MRLRASRRAGVLDLFGRDWPAYPSAPTRDFHGRRIIPPAAQRRMAERAGATITEVDASHVSMVSHPDVSVAAILAAVAAIDD